MTSFPKNCALGFIPSWREKTSHSCSMKRILNKSGWQWHSSVESAGREGLWAKSCTSCRLKPCAFPPVRPSYRERGGGEAGCNMVDRHYPPSEGKQEGSWYNKKTGRYFLHCLLFVITVCRVCLIACKLSSVLMKEVPKIQCYLGFNVIIKQARLCQFVLMTKCFFRLLSPFLPFALTYPAQ